MSESCDIIKNILEIEWTMFQKVKSDSPASCQTSPNKFQKIRGSIFDTWSVPMLRSYLNDLKIAFTKGNNLLTLKYARMDDLIPSLNLNPLIDEIVIIEKKWQEEICNRYPALYSRLGRSMDPSEDGSYFAVYLQCELETYSNNTIELYYQHVKQAWKIGINLSLKSLLKLVKKGGYRDLSQAENICKRIYKIKNLQTPATRHPGKPRKKGHSLE